MKNNKKYLTRNGWEWGGKIYEKIEKDINVNPNQEKILAQIKEKSEKRKFRWKKDTRAIIKWNRLRRITEIVSRKRFKWICSRFSFEKNVVNLNWIYLVKFKKTSQVQEIQVMF